MKKPNKRLAVFLDGTWFDTMDNTNVWRLKSLCASVDGEGCSQLVYYHMGVSGLWGGAFGKGLIDNVIQGYEWLVENYEQDDEIFIFGFSRGAFTARSLAGLVAKYGLLRAGAPLGVGQLYERYRRGSDRTIWKLHALQNEGKLDDANLEERWMLKFCMPVTIKMVAVWDTVGSLGIPFLQIPGISRSTLSFLHTGLRIPIENGFHALAIDEHRHSFSPTLWTVKKSTQAAPRSIDSVEQRWFVGAHGNVGGGCHSDLLAQRPLKWIRDKAEALGLCFRYPVNVDGDMATATIIDSYGNFMRGAYSWFTKRYYRPIGQIEMKVQGAESVTVNETIDSFVFERWRQDASYRPPQITDWATRKRVDPVEINSSVRADDPTVSLPN